MTSAGNCHSRAWGRFVTDGGYLVLRRSPYAKRAKWLRKWWWPDVAAGTAIQHATAWANAIGWVLRWRGFYHVIYAETLHGPYWHFVPLDKKSPRNLPPFWFRGQWVKVDEQHEAEIVEREKVLLRGDQ